MPPASQHPRSSHSGWITAPDTWAHPVPVLSCSISLVPDRPHLSSYPKAQQHQPVHTLCILQGLGLGSSELSFWIKLSMLPAFPSSSLPLLLLSLQLQGNSPVGLLTSPCLRLHVTPYVCAVFHPSWSLIPRVGGGILAIPVPFTGSCIGLHICVIKLRRSL